MPLEPATRPPKSKQIDITVNGEKVDDLRRLNTTPRRTQRVSERRAAERPRLAATDRRRNRKADPRNIQFASNTTAEVDAIWRESIARWDITKADFLEHAIRLMAKKLEESGGLWEEQGMGEG